MRMQIEGCTAGGAHAVTLPVHCGKYNFSECVWSCRIWIVFYMYYEGRIKILNFFWGLGVGGWGLARVIKTKQQQ